jgi:23S rRNA G2445 N2-methylase RlmL
LVTSCRDGIVGIEAGYFASGKAVRFFDKDKFPFWNYNFVDESYLTDLDGKEEKTKIVAVDGSAHNVTVAKKNAKIAGVEKVIKMSMMDLQWLDTKFDEGSVDRVIGHLPSVSKHRDEKQTAKLFKEFFYQVSFILSKKGRIVTLTPKPDLLEEVAKEYKIKKIKEKILAQGQSNYTLMVWSK